MLLMTMMFPTFSACQVTGLPILFASVNGLHLQQPVGLEKESAHEVSDR